MIEADELAAVEVHRVRRRQLINAMLHGSSRSWTVARRRWPAVVVGCVLAIVVTMGVAMTQVVRDQLGQPSGSTASHR